MADAALDTIFKAYDIRGIYPDEIDEDIARRVGNAFVALHRRRPGARRSRRPPVVGAARRRVHRGRDHGRRRRRRPRARVHRPLLLRGGQPRRAGRDVHREPQPGAVQRHQAVPRRCGARSARRPACARSRRWSPTASSSGARTRAASSAATCSRRSSRTCTRSSTSTRWRRSASSPTPPTASVGSSCPRSSRACRSTLSMLFGELDGTFPNHPADPTSVENLKDLAACGDRRRRRRRPRVRRRRRPRGARRRPGPARVGLDHHRDPRGRHPRRISADAEEPDRRVVHNLICSKAVPEVIRELGGTPIRSRVGPLVHQAGDGRDRRGLRRRALGALLLPRQLPRRLRHHRRAHGARAAVDHRASPLSELRKPVRAVRDVGRDQHPRRRPRGGDRARSPPRTPRRSRTGSTASPSISATGGSTCAPSNTEPLLRLNLEAADRDACDERTAEVLAVVRGTNLT